jgi:hypothetical protein
MIVLQSPLTEVAERTAISLLSVVGMSSPGGEETGEGELNCSSGRQPTLSEVQPCPSGTSENSQQHRARDLCLGSSSQANPRSAGTAENSLSARQSPSLSKVFQGVPTLFLGKKRLFIFHQDEARERRRCPCRPKANRLDG